MIPDYLKKSNEQLKKNRAVTRFTDEEWGRICREYSRLKQHGCPSMSEFLRSAVLSSLGRRYA